MEALDRNNLKKTFGYYKASDVDRFLDAAQEALEAGNRQLEDRSSELKQKLEEQLAEIPEEIAEEIPDVSEEELNREALEAITDGEAAEE